MQILIGENKQDCHNCPSDTSATPVLVCYHLISQQFLLFTARLQERLPPLDVLLGLCLIAHALQLDNARRSLLLQKLAPYFVARLVREVLQMSVAQVEGDVVDDVNDYLHARVY